MKIVFMCCWVVQAWRDVHLRDTIDRTPHQNYNMDALIFSLLQQLPLAQSELLQLCEVYGNTRKGMYFTKGSVVFRKG